MKRHGLPLVTLATLLFTGGILDYAGWFLPCASPAASRLAATRSPARPCDPLNSSAAARWRQGQSNHWRSCLLQRANGW